MRASRRRQVGHIVKDYGMPKQGELGLVGGEKEVSGSRFTSLWVWLVVWTLLVSWFGAGFVVYGEQNSPP